MPSYAFTRQGMLRLGGVIRTAMEEQGLTIDKFAEILRDKADYPATHAKLQRLREGVTTEPSIGLLWAITRYGLVKHPNGTPYTLEEFLLIACEQNASEDPVQVILQGGMSNLTFEELKAMCDDLYRQYLAALERSGLNLNESEDLNRFARMLKADPKGNAMQRLKDFANQARNPEVEDAVVLAFAVRDLLGLLSQEQVAQVKAISCPHC